MRANFPVHSARTLREEIRATTRENDKALLLHELSRLFLFLGDYQSAAQAAESALEILPEFVEPLETAVTLQHLRDDDGRLPDLLGRLAKAGRDSKIAHRAGFEFLAALISAADLVPLSADDAGPLVEQVLKDGSTDSSTWLLAEVAGALTRDLRLQNQAAQGRAGLAHSPAVRAALLERAASHLTSLGRGLDAVACLQQALEEAPSPELRRRLIQKAREHSLFDLAFELSQADLRENPEDSRPLALVEAGILAVQAEKLEEGQVLLRELGEAAATDPFPAFFAAWLAKSTGDKAALSLALRDAAERLPESEREEVELAQFLLAESPLVADLDLRSNALSEPRLRLGFRLGHRLLRAGDSDAHLQVYLEEFERVPASQESQALLEFFRARAALARGELRSLPYNRPGQFRSKVLQGGQLAAIWGRALGWLQSSGLQSSGLQSSGDEAPLLFDAASRERRVEQLRRAYADSGLPDELGFLLQLALLDRELDMAELRASGIRRLEAMHADDPKNSLVVQALASSLSATPLARADVLFRAASGALEPRLGAVWAIQAGLEYAHRGRNETATLALNLAEELLPGCLGRGRLYLPRDGESEDSASGLDPISGLLQRASRLLRRDLQSLADQFAYESPQEREELALLGAVVSGTALNVPAAREWLRPLGLPEAEALLFEVGVAMDADEIELARERLREAARTVAEDRRLAFLDSALGLREREEPPEARLEGLVSQEGPYSSMRVLAELCAREQWGQAFFQMASMLADEPGAASTTLEVERANQRLLEAYYQLFLGLRDGDREALQQAIDLTENTQGSASEVTLLVGRVLAARGLGAPSEARDSMRLAEHSALDPRERAQLYERAGFLLAQASEHGTEAARCFERCLELDPGAEYAFAWLAEQAEQRGDVPALLGLVEARLSSELPDLEETELLQFCRASYLKALGRPAAALVAFETLRDSPRFGVRALSSMSELNLALERKSQAADCLIELCRAGHMLPEEHQRAAAEHAAELLEEVGRHREALAMSHEAERYGTPEPKLRMLRVRNAIASASYGEAFEALAIENDTCDQIPERLRAAELMLALQEQHLRDALAYADAARRVLRDNPLHAAAQNAVLALPFSRDERRLLLGPALEATLELAQRTPLDGALIRRFVELALAAGDAETRTLAEGLRELMATEPKLQLERRGTPGPFGELTDTDKKLLRPRSLLDADMRVLEALGRAVARLTEPDLEAFGLSYLLRVETPDDHALFGEVSAWQAVFGRGELQVFVGGSDPSACLVLQREPGVCIFGSAVESPLTRRQSAELAMQLLAFEQGWLSLQSLSDTSLGLWLRAAADGPTSGEPEVADRARALEEVLLPPEREILREHPLIGSGAGRSAAELVGALRTYGLRVALAALGDVSVLRGLQDKLPEDATLRDRALEDLLSFALGGEMTRLHRKVVLR